MTASETFLGTRHVTDKPKRRPGRLLYIPLHQHPGHHSQCLILMSLLVFRILTLILVREQGFVGAGHGTAAESGDMERNRPFVLVREAIKTENAV